MIKEYTDLLYKAMEEDIYNQIYYELKKATAEDSDKIMPPPIKTAPVLADIIEGRIKKEVEDAFYAL